jgi:predicted RNA-binding protein with RPS1 domain
MHRRAFCPIGQIDLPFVENPEEYVGNTYRFVITRFEEDGRNLVVSRRELLNRELEAEREEFLQGITVDAELEGRVRRIVPYGAFVELFPGIEGMVHISELSWSRLERPEEVLSVGETVRVKIIGIEKGDSPEGIRITLSIKQMTGDPWDTVGETFDAVDTAADFIISRWGLCPYDCNLPCQQPTEDNCCPIEQMEIDCGDTDEEIDEFAAKMRALQVECWVLAFKAAPEEMQRKVWGH